MKRVLAAAIFAPLVCLMVWVGFLQLTKASGREVRVTIKGYDPRDLLSGRYLAFEIDWSKTNCSQFADNKCPQNEFCHQATWGRECRFYVDERKADDLDAMFRSRRWDHSFEVVYSYTPGREPIAKQLLVDGQDWEEHLKNNPL